MTKPLFPPIAARALKHNEKNDTSKNPCPQISGHTQFLSTMTISDAFWRLEKQNVRFETAEFPQINLQFLSCHAGEICSRLGVAKRIRIGQRTHLPVTSLPLSVPGNHRHIISHWEKERSSCNRQFHTTQQIHPQEIP